MSDRRRRGLRTLVTGAGSGLGLGLATYLATTICPAYVRTPLIEAQIAAQARTHGIPEQQVTAQ